MRTKLKIQLMFKVIFEQIQGKLPSFCKVFPELINGYFFKLMSKIFRTPIYKCLRKFTESGHDLQNDLTCLYYIKINSNDFQLQIIFSIWVVESWPLCIV